MKIKELFKLPNLQKLLILGFVAGVIFPFPPAAFIGGIGYAVTLGYEWFLKRKGK